MDPDFEERFSSSRGCPYYYNKRTGESQWEVPGGGGSDWEERFDELSVLLFDRLDREDGDPVPASPAS